jgi:hypothetical protein
VNAGRLLVSMLFVDLHCLLYTIKTIEWNLHTAHNWVHHAKCQQYIDPLIVDFVWSSSAGKVPNLDARGVVVIDTVTDCDRALKLVVTRGVEAGPVVMR